MSIGVPVKIFHEAKEHVVTVELKTGELFRGYLLEAEDSMNMFLNHVRMTTKDGQQKHLDQVYIRGSQISFIQIPDILKYSPQIKRVQSQAKGKNIAMMREKGRRARQQLFAGKEGVGMKQ